MAIEELDDGTHAGLRVGEFLVSIGAMTEKQVEEVLAEQEKAPEKLFGQIAIEMGFIDDSAINRYLEETNTDQR